MSLFVKMIVCLVLTMGLGLLGLVILETDTASMLWFYLLGTLVGGILFGVRDSGD